MRLNVYLAHNTGLSRRAADRAVMEGRVFINGQPAIIGRPVQETDQVSLDGRLITPNVKTQTVMLNKPVGYVCSRAGQGSKTIYDLLPEELHHLKPVGRLDKDSSGLILLTNDGQLANQLTHPRYQKTKVYEVKLNKPLKHSDFEKISKQGVHLDDGLSKLGLEPINNQDFEWKITMAEGRNRQIRRTFAALGYNVNYLHRIALGEYLLTDLNEGSYAAIK